MRQMSQVTVAMDAATAYQESAKGSSDAKLLAAGEQVCTQLRAHVDPGAVLQGLAKQGWTQLSAMAIVHTAAMGPGLCLDQLATMQAWYDRYLTASPTPSS
jgi:hypothetical protein